MAEVNLIDAGTLSSWLQSGKKVSIIDVRPPHEQTEWFIPQSIHTDAYARLKQNDRHALDGLTLDKDVPVVTYCAAGKTSMVAAELLKEQGYEVYSLKDGMKGWSLAWNTAMINFKNYLIVQFRRTGKGCLSYMIVSGFEAIIVDASLSAGAYKQMLAENDWQLTAVMETHIHADHLSRSKQLADEFDVPLFLPTPNKVSFPFRPLENGQRIVLGDTYIKVISTPGHTVESVSFLVNNEALLSGDTIFTNSVGRPDLKADTGEAAKRAALLYDSLQAILTLGDHLMVLPGHASTPVDFDNKPVRATISEIKKNVAILQLSKADFVKAIMDKLPPAPPNYLAIVERNLSGNDPDANAVELEAGANRCAVS